MCLIYLRSEIDENAEAKCLAVNPVRTEYIAVGANDPYARVYDRRMLKRISTGNRNMERRRGGYLKIKLENDVIKFINNIFQTLRNLL